MLVSIQAIGMYHRHINIGSNPLVPGEGWKTKYALDACTRREELRKLQGLFKLFQRDNALWHSNFGVGGYRVLDRSQGAPFYDTCAKC
eukprot:1155573-Pelagomonas_calceolata.AAC.1